MPLKEKPVSSDNLRAVKARAGSQAAGRSKLGRFSNPTWSQLLAAQFCNRIMEFPVLEGTHKDYRVQLLSLHSTSQQSHHDGPNGAGFARPVDGQDIPHLPPSSMIQ